MTKTKKIDASQLKIEDITISKSSIENETDWKVIPKNHCKFTISLVLNIEINQDQGLLKMTLINNIVVNNKDDTPANITAAFEIIFIFKVKDIKNHVDAAGEIEEELLLKLVNITYSTSRGIFYAKSQGTVFSNFYLPILPDDALIDFIGNTESEQDVSA